MHTEFIIDVRWIGNKVLICASSVTLCQLLNMFSGFSYL